MPRPRKENNCAGGRLNLCDENLTLVKQKEAEFTFQTNRSFIVNKLLDELREYRQKFGPITNAK